MVICGAGRRIKEFSRAVISLCASVFSMEAWLRVHQHVLLFLLGIFFFFLISFIGTSLVIQWLRLHVSTAGGVGWIPGHRTKIPHTAQQGKKKNVLFSSSDLKFCL